MIYLDQLVEFYQDGNLDHIKGALIVLHDSQALIHQARKNKASILDSFDTEDPASLAEKILQVRQANRTLFALHELGATLKKERDNA